MESCNIVGIDAAGPTNLKDTCVAIFERSAKGMNMLSYLTDATDQFIYDEVKKLRGAVVIGIDAPLSYECRSGDRPSDRALRKPITELGLRSGSIMAPLAPRMVYLTLRGVVLARLFREMKPSPDIVEVHPGAAMVLRGAPVESVREMKRSPEAKLSLLHWFRRQGITGLKEKYFYNDHLISAVAAAIAAKDWAEGKSQWIEKAKPPFTPFDFSC